MTTLDSADVLATATLLAGTALLTSCGGASAAAASDGGSGGGDNGPLIPSSSKISITSLTVKASGTPVTVNSINGGANGVTYTLGGSGSQTMPADPGAGTTVRTYTFIAAPTATPAQSETLEVVLNPGPAETLSAWGSPTLAATRDSLARLGFPRSWSDVLSHAGMTHNAIVDRVVARLRTEPYEPYPAWIDNPILSYRQQLSLSQAERTAIEERKYPRRQELKQWWFGQMVRSPDALGERLLLFWHNLFTTAGGSVQEPELMARQDRLFRQKMSGDFRDFVKSMSRDPAMCEYLDSARNSARDERGNALVPNENFARELLELFLLGESKKYGGYIESDIKDLAHFFTGYHLDYENNRRFAFNVAAHNTNDKTLFGQIRTGTNPAGGYEADGDWAIDRIMEKTDSTGTNYCAFYIVSRLWQEFIGTPGAGNRTQIKAIAAAFAADWNLSKLYQTFFKSAAFAAPFNDPNQRGLRIRSPVELWVGFYRALGIAPEKVSELMYTFLFLEQDLLDPPNVFGWPGNESWIDLKSVIDRRYYLGALAYSDGMNKIPAEFEAIAPLLLLAREPVDPPYTFPDWRSNSLKMRISRFFVDPAYNLG